MRLQIRLKRRMRWNETRDRREKKARTQLYLYDLFKWRPFKRGLRAKKNEIGRGLWAEEDWLGRGELRLVSSNQNGWKIIQTIKLFFNIAFLPSTEINRQFVNNQFISND